MVRHIVLGNQQLLVNIDQWLQVRDIYFPHVGQYNHLLGHAHKIGVIEGENLSWINEDSWKKEVGYLNETLVTNSSATGMGLSLNLNENVYCEDNIFFRRINVKNLTDKKRTIRIFVHHDFHLYGDGVGDTAYYDPELQAIVHYKRSTYFLIGFCDAKNQKVVPDFDIAEHVNAGWQLAKRPIHQGEVDSIIAIDLNLPAKKSVGFAYYLCAGKNLEEVIQLQKKFLKQGVDAHLKHTQMCQRGWLAKIKPDISKLSKSLQQLYRRSLLIMKTQIDREGAIIAAGDSDNMQFNRDTYSYLWPRDGALVSIALIKAGFEDTTKPFFEFCRDVMYKEGCLLHKYNPDRTLGSSWHPWVLDDKYSLPIQEDETALVLVALLEYYNKTKDKKFIKKLYPKFIKPMGQFLAKYRYPNGLPKESYDLWEERRGIFTFTTSTVLAGLIAAEKLGHLFKDQRFCTQCSSNFESIKKAMLAYLYNKEKGYFRRGIFFEKKGIQYDDTMDSSVYGVFAFGAFKENDPEVVSTMKTMKKQLWVNTGGMARYYQDNYHRQVDGIPNPWFVCTLWYAKWLIKMKELKEALKIIQWAADHALSTGVLAEQIHPVTGEPLSVSPLTWSHAEFVDVITDYVKA